ncbi:MAG: putative 2-aminoethylphosphonate ABC transporter substrate-binding protein [Solidesulfovibrio sp.]|uniref:putative 2-aminoethylphosphonate ABC transporter substrate-binding protein n=1 Tax=Solidesulfovibrio sp. TaxID=2910990 RepID=UPI002B1EFAE1|nr:putative 2-aminoethylphosphonate ABC transporter substrate-binding protein [Solidesulfovibrio sp.]MEA4855287.1 putative 2-aminoethylphosphonate ABC transporter substrate-binding protein [Solidesulfovibrio sp.]
MKKRLACLVLVCLALTAASRVARAAELLVYTALEDDQIPVYIKSFKEQYPDIQLKFVRDSTGVVISKLLAEKDNPQADLVWGTAATGLLLLEAAGIVEPYAPKGLERINPRFRDPRNPPAWVANDVFETGLCVNELELGAKKLPAPAAYADLVKPEYKGLVVMPNPASSGTGYLTVAGLMALLGEEQAWAYLDKLHENIAMYTHSGSKPCKMAGTGEFPIGITFGYRGVMQKRKGEPVTTVFPKEGSGWDCEANALIRKKDMKPEAKLFLDWAVSDPAMIEYAKNYGILAASDVPGFQVPEGYPADPVAQLIPVDLTWAAQNRDRILAEWEKRYGAKSEAKK